MPIVSCLFNHGKKKSSYESQYWCASVSANLGDREKGERYLLLALESNPGDSIAHSRLGRAYSFQRRWSESERHFQRSLELNPKDPKTRKWFEDIKRARERYR